MLRIGDNMIGDERTLKEIEEKLKEIANKNRQKFGHILDYTDFPDGTKIKLGTVKNDYDKLSRKEVFFDILFGNFSYSGESPAIIHDKYFSLSADFEKDMEEKIESLNIAFDKERKEEFETIELLDKILNG